MSTLQTVVPVRVAGSPATDSFHSPLPSRRDGLRRVLQVYKTATPLCIADCLIIIAVQWLINAIATGPLLSWESMVLTVWQSMLYLTVGLLCGIFPGTGVNPIRMLRTQTYLIMFCGFVIATLAATRVPVETMLVFLTGVAACSIVLPFMRSVIRRFCARFSWWGERAIVVGTTSNSLAIFDFLAQNPHFGLRPVGVVDNYAADYWMSATNSNIPFLGVTRELQHICSRQDCYWVIATTGGVSKSELDELLTSCGLIPNLIVTKDDMPVPSLWTCAFDAAGLNGIHIQDRLLFPFARMTKRIFDVVVASGLLLASSPLLILIWGTIRISSRGPALFGHKRIGRNGRPFEALKFRTMIPESSEVLREYLRKNPAARREWERNQKLKHDPRIIPGIGHFLRRWSLDELPQLFNVLVGDMSLCGPRPIVHEEVEKYGMVFPLYCRVRPGLTGLWQVSGRNGTTYPARVQLDSYYVRNWSMWLDYYVLLRTIKTVLTCQGSC